MALHALRGMPPLLQSICWLCGRLPVCGDAKGIEAGYGFLDEVEEQLYQMDKIEDDV